MNYSLLLLLALSLQISLFGQEKRSADAALNAVNETAITWAGQIVDENGEALIGANIYFESNLIGVASDANGMFKLPASASQMVATTSDTAIDDTDAADPDSGDPDGDDSGTQDPEQEHIIVSFLGYKSKRLPLKGRTQSEQIVLETNEINLETVIISAWQDRTEICCHRGCGVLIIKTNSEEQRQSNAPLKLNLNVFPNPTQDFLTVTSETELGLLNLFNLNGQLVQTQQMGSAQQAKIDLRELAAGTYILQFANGETRKLNKIN